MTQLNACHPELAVETLNHTMASGASSGIGLADSGGKDRFFSERSLIKLRINDLNGTSKSIINSEEDVAGKIIPFSNGLQVPNNLLSGNNAFTNLKVRNIALRGRIGELEEELKNCSKKDFSLPLLNLGISSITNPKVYSY